MNNENKTTTQDPKHQNPKNQGYTKQPLTQDPKNQEPAKHPTHNPIHDTTQNKPSEQPDSTHKLQGETQKTDKTKTATGGNK
ncbi:MAG: hypothetical protein WA715_20070 [Candidatus Acidiferrum sp.]|jgi:hypothetical protein